MIYFTNRTKVKKGTIKCPWILFAWLSKYSTLCLGLKLWNFSLPSLFRCTVWCRPSITWVQLASLASATGLRQFPPLHRLKEFGILSRQSLLGCPFWSRQATFLICIPSPQVTLQEDHGSVAQEEQLWRPGHSWMEEGLECLGQDKLSTYNIFFTLFVQLSFSFCSWARNILLFY